MIDNIKEGTAYAQKRPFSGNIIFIDPSKLKNISDLELRGLLAHEISHLIQYKDKNNFQMVIFGLKYLISDNFKLTTEREAETIAIERGFAKELLAFLEFKEKNSDSKELARREKYYFNRTEIESISKK